MVANTHWSKKDEAVVWSQTKDYGSKVPGFVIDGLAVVLKNRTPEAIRHKAQRLRAKNGAQLRLLREKEPPRAETLITQANQETHEELTKMFPPASEPVGVEPEPLCAGKDVEVDPLWYVAVGLIALGFIVAFVMLYQLLV